MTRIGRIGTDHFVKVSSMEIRYIRVIRGLSIACRGEFVYDGFES